MFKRRVVRRIIIAAILLSIVSLGALIALAYGIAWIENWDDRFNECAQVTKYIQSGEFDSPHLQQVRNLVIPNHLQSPITALNASRMIELSKGSSGDFARLLWSKDRALLGQTSGYDSNIVRIPGKNAALYITLLGSDSTAIRECDLSTGKQSQYLRWYSARALQFSPDTKLLAINDGHGSINLLDAQTYVEKGLLSKDRSQLRSSALAFSPDGSMLAFATHNYGSIPEHYEIEIWDIKAQKNVAVLRGHTNTINALSFNQDGSLLASTSQDGTVRIWGIESP